MAGSRFLYVTYIRTTPERLWEMLTTPDWQRRYWFGMSIDCAIWEQGVPWKLVFSDGRVADSGAVLECDPPRRLVLSWRNQWKPELHDEGEARATFVLEATGGTVKLTVTHEIDRPESMLIEAVSGGWPKILSGLKSLLETGTTLDRADL